MTHHVVNDAKLLLRSHRFVDADAHRRAWRMLEIIEAMEEEDRQAVGDLWLINLRILVERKGVALSSDAA
jgi:hypothetical protein